MSQGFVLFGFIGGFACPLLFSRGRADHFAELPLFSFREIQDPQSNRKETKFALNY